MPKKHFKNLICIALAAAALAGCAQKPSAGGEEAKLSFDTPISDYTVSSVSAEGDFFENALEKEIDYLMSLDPERLLVNFRKNAGILTDLEPYGGWENSLIGGHTIGHYLTALSQAYVNAATPSSDRKKIYGRITELVDGLAECQRKNGFLWGASFLSVNVEEQFDNVEKGRCDIFKEAWVPWYTMHKILEGLISVYAETGYQPSLDIACRLGDWVCDRTKKWNDDTRRTVLSIEYGGMNDAMYDLYALTGEKKYADAAHVFDEDALFERIRSGGLNVLNNLHANTTIPKVIGAMKRWLVLGESAGDEYLETAEIFWQTVIDHHTYATGGNSEWEHFGEDDVLNLERTNCNCETCNVYNMLKLTKYLFDATGDKKYADYYENAFINHIMASQNPETGMTTYFQAMATGYFRTYSTPTDSFWCCTGSGMENMTKLGDGIYFNRGGDIIVNMYLSSVLEDPTLGLKITQTSDIPESDVAKFELSLKEPKEFALRLRIPDWAAGDISLTVNGESCEFAEEAGYAVIERKWKDGDAVEVKIPLALKALNLQDGVYTLCFKYGPVLLAAKLSDENMSTTYTGMSVIIPEKTTVQNDTLILNEGILPKDVKAEPAKYFKKGEGLSFEFEAVSEPMEFVPYYSLYNTRYGIYWRLKEAE